MLNNEARRMGGVFAATILCTLTTLQALEISRYTIDGGGVMFSTGGNFVLSGTIGQSAEDAGAPASFETREKA